MATIAFSTSRHDRYQGVFLLLIFVAAWLFPLLRAAADDPEYAGFELKAPFTKIYWPKKSSAVKGKSNSQPIRAAGWELFQLSRSGESPEHGFYNIAGKPTPITWKSTNPRVVHVEQRGTSWEVNLLAPGRTTISVAIGKWQSKANLEIAEVPFWIGMPVPELLKRYGYPDEDVSKPPPQTASFDIGDYDPWGRNKYWLYKKWPNLAVRVNESNIRGITTLRKLTEAEIAAKEKAK